MALSDLFRAVAALFARAPAPLPAAPGGSAPGVPPAAPMQASRPETQAESGAPAPPGPAETDWLALCRPLTAASESCVLVAYPDPASGGEPWTIGYGATGPGIAKGVTWTQAQADGRLDADLTRFAAVVDRHVTAPLTPAQKAALVDFAFNVGEGNFAGSTLVRKLNAGDYYGATAEFARWNLAAGKVMPGLVVRRARERDLFLTGKWSST